MGVTSAIVLFAITWFMVMFIVLPIGLRTQGDAGEKVRGTHAGAPADFNLRKVVIRVTLITVVLWAGEVALISSGLISVRDLDWNHTMPPETAGDSN